MYKGMKLYKTIANLQLLLWLTDTGGWGAPAGPSGVCESHYEGTPHVYILQDEEEDGFPPARWGQAAQRTL